MRRVEGLVELSRRGFCVACAGVAVIACGTSDPGGVDAPTGSGGPDAPTGGACATTAVDVGAATSYQLNTPVYISSGRFFVVRDTGGLYALTSLCTHEGAVTQVSGTHFYCPRHGAQFTFNGAVISGPVSRPLVHFAMCILANGHLGVATATQVPASTRLVA